jgi:hypothetical protein
MLAQVGERPGPADSALAGPTVQQTLDALAITRGRIDAIGDRAIVRLKIRKLRQTSRGIRARSGSCASQPRSI